MRPQLVDRPTHFPSVFAWLGAGMWRNWRGLAGALVAGWSGLPLALVGGVVGAGLGGVVGLAAGVFGSVELPRLIADAPLVGPVVAALPVGLGGMLGAVLGLPLGLVVGASFTFGLLWVTASEGDPVAATGTVLAVVAAAMLVGMLYVGYRVVAEGMLLRAAGVRRPSRRERELLLPVVLGCTERLGLPGYPPILMDDSPRPRAAAYTRHIVISHGLLVEFGYDQEVIAAVVSHALVHWRNGDPLSAAFVRGVALPVYLVYAAVGWLRQRANHVLVTVLLWVVFWPILLTVRLVALPLQAADTRRAEFRADQGAVLAGHRDGLRRVLSRLRTSFETGRNGWDAAVCGLHPPAELRLERLEDPAQRYPLPEPDLAIPTGR